MRGQADIDGTLKRSDVTSSSDALPSEIKAKDWSTVKKGSSSVSSAQCLDAAQTLNVQNCIDLWGSCASRSNVCSCRKEMVSDHVYPLFLNRASALESPRASRKPGRGAPKEKRLTDLQRRTEPSCDRLNFANVSQGSRARGIDCKWAHLLRRPLSEHG